MSSKKFIIWHQFPSRSRRLKFIYVIYRCVTILFLLIYTAGNKKFPFKKVSIFVVQKEFIIAVLSLKMGTRHSLHLFYACIWNHVLLSTYSLYTMEICCISMQKIIISYCDMLHLAMVYALLYCIQYSFIIDLINNVVIVAHFSEDEYGDLY